MTNEKKIIADKFIVMNYSNYKQVGEFSSLDEALEESFSNDNYEVIILDKDGNNVSMDYWRENY